MKKTLRIVLMVALVAALGACGKKQDDVTSTEGTYSIHVGGYDWGAEVNKITLTLDHPVGNVDKDSFVVKETKQSTDWSQVPEFPIIEVTNEKNILDAYVVDENGNKVEGESKYVVIELDPHPYDGSIFLFSLGTMFNTYSDPYFLEITLNEGADLSVSGNELEGLEINTVYTNKTTDADDFKLDSYATVDGVTYDYAYYEPEADSDVLVVWLHGMGEGGVEKTDPYLTLLANRVPSLISKEFQDKIGAAHVLVPQSPTFWMDTDGETSDISKADGTSFYTASLIELIENYEENHNISKTVVIGASNGGYMTLVLALENPDKYAAIVPICEAIPNENVSDAQIESLVNLPMYFIYANNDETVNPELHEAPKIKRLQEAGATNLNVATTDDVVDLSGVYKDAEGNQFVYNAHWSWIYFFNNESVENTTGLTAWDFIADSLK